MKKLFFGLIFLLSTVIVRAEAPGEKGTCYKWSEIDGTAYGPGDCAVSTLAECGKGNKAVESKPSAFQKHKGKLFQTSEAGEYTEFRSEPVALCQKARVVYARASEADMSSRVGFVAHSEDLIPGNRAYVYGSSVTLRETPSVKGKKVSVPADRSPVQIIGRSKTRDTVQGLFPAYWFQVTVDGKKGWIYGQFIHPDPDSPKSFLSSPGCDTGGSCM